MWKKNSVGVRPLKKLFFTNPLAAGAFATWSVKSTYTAKMLYLAHFNKNGALSIARAYRKRGHATHSTAK